jgi:hypothetical protein
MDVTLSRLCLLVGLVGWLAACAGDDPLEPSDASSADAGSGDAADAGGPGDAPGPDTWPRPDTGRDSLDGPTDLARDSDAVVADSGSDATSDAADAGTDGISDAADVEDVDADSLPPYPEPTQMGWIYDVDDTFWANMDDFVLGVLAEHDVGLYLTVFSANFFNKEAYRALGAEIIRHPESFFANAVIPLLERYGDSGVIWAIDCMNEPEALIAAPNGNRAEWGVSWEEMQAFLGYCADMVHLHSLIPVSAGSGWHDWKNVEQGYYTGLGFDFLDFHHYADAPVTPSVEALGVDLPVIIGECGQSTREWDDDLQLAAVRGCFSRAIEGGYAAAFSWYYDYAGSLNHHAHLEADGSWRPVEAAFAEAAASDLWLGINLAWFSGAYDHDMAVNLRHPSWAVAYDHDYAVSVVEDLEAHDVELLRFWVFEGGEGLYLHAFFEDFEEGIGRWASLGDGVSLRSSALHATDGRGSMALHFDPDAAGWYGAAVHWSTDTPLNLATASEWRFDVTSDMDDAVGVNLAFVVETESGPVTYQTRSGAGGGQIWLDPGESAAHTVSLSTEEFTSQWALATAPGEGVSRPGESDLQHISEIRLRVYVSEAQLPLGGDLFVDALRIR